MRIKNRLFPYPLLHHDKIESSYKYGEFTLDFCDEKDDENYIMNLRAILVNNTLKNLVDAGKATIVCVVECPQAMYRKSYVISQEFQLIKIPLYDLVGSVEISSFIYANQDIDEYSPDNLSDEYLINQFSIEKYSILAVDNGFNQKIHFEDFDDTKKKSIFVLVTNLDENAKTIEWEYDSDLIKIFIPEYQHKEYEAIKHQEETQKIFLSLFAITPLTMIISELIKNEELVSDLKFKYKWFIGFCEAYKRVNNVELTDEEFSRLDNRSIYNVLQKIFDYAIVDSVDQVFELCNGMGGFYDN